MHVLIKRELSHHKHHDFVRVPMQLSVLNVFIKGVNVVVWCVSLVAI